MDYYNDVLTIFLGLKHGSCVAVYAAILIFYLNLCSEDERVLRVWNDMRVSN